VHAALGGVTSGTYSVGVATQMPHPVLVAPVVGMRQHFDSIVDNNRVVDPC
jgi:hypothetical protein